MNAARHNLKQYDRAKAPVNSTPLRFGSVQNVEFLDENRSQKLREAAEIHRIEEERLRIAELEHYYNLKPEKNAKSDVQKHVKTGRRKIDACCIIMQNTIPIKKCAQNAVDENNNKKRLILSEFNKADSILHKNTLLMRTKSASVTIFSILVVFAMLSCVLIKQAQISNQTYLNSQLEKEIDSLNIELSKLNMDRALKEDLTSVQYSAGLKGMSRPADLQVVFISVNPQPIDNYQDTNETSVSPDEDMETESKNAVSNLKDNKSNDTFNRFTDFFKEYSETVKGWVN